MVKNETRAAAAPNPDDNEVRAASKPNPDDWVDIEGAAMLLGRSRATVYNLIDAGVLTLYKIGAHRCLWRAEVWFVASAYRVLRARRG